MLKISEQIDCVEVEMNDGMQARCSEREFKISPGSRNFVLSLGHEPLGRGCTERETDIHNPFKMAAANPVVSMPGDHW